MRHTIGFLSLAWVFVTPGCFATSATVSLVSDPSATRFGVGAGPQAVAVADLDSDGKLDLAVACAGPGAATILLGDGRGSFHEAKGSPCTAGSAPNDIAVADFDGDGRLDLAFANHEQRHLTVLVGDGTGTFRPAPGSPFAVDVAPHTHGVAAADLDGDGRTDLLTDSWGTNELCVLAGDGKGGFRTPGTRVAVGKHPYQRPRVADLDRDGRADVIVPDLDGNDVTVLLGEGRGTFRRPVGAPFPAGDAPFGVAVGDVNADGKLDLVVVDSPSMTSDRTGLDGITILLGDGAGRFALMRGSPFACGRGPSQAAIGDLNRDGVGDIVVTNQNSATITIFAMDRKGGVRSASTVAVGREPDGVAIADFDGDGRGDIVVCDSGEADVRILLGAKGWTTAS